jgi:D-alanyl-lipoteichoic acid acyltransferase DltB (MBOAT superfamily)
VAVGVAEMFGIRLTENFERPFFSKSISEYWQRWHITLGTWFKDYIFYPLSVNKSIIKFGKKVRERRFAELGRRIPIYVPMLFVWILTGMWHGSESRFVVWGLCNYVFIVLGTELEGVSSKIVAALRLKETGFVMKSYRAFKTFWLMSMLRLFDINKTPGEALKAFRYIFTDWRGFDVVKVYEQLSLPYEDFVVALIAIAVLFVLEMIQRKGSIRKRIFAMPVPLQWVILSILIVAVSVFGYYGPGYDAQSFIYGAF